VAAKPDRTIGVDFGTSTTLVATGAGGGRTDVVPIGKATEWMPSVVGLDSSGVLATAEDAEALPRSSIIRSVKLAVTRREQVVETPDGRPVPVEDAVRAILTAAVTRSGIEGTDVDAAATIQLGCPAMWQAPERQLLVRIANDCGIAVDLGHVIDEPIAAGVVWIEDYLLSGGRLPDTKVLVFDPGGGTLDVALLHVRTGEVGDPEITVLSADGTDESGDALDDAIASDLAADGTLRSLIARDPVVSDLLGDRARELKELLTSENRSRRPLGGGYPDVIDYERQRLEAVFQPQLVRAERLVKSVVRAAKLREQQTLTHDKIRALSWAQVSDGIGIVVLVGGLSQIPLVHKWMSELFPDAEIRLVSNPQQAVVRGLALSERFERLNLHRPAFNFSLSFFGAHHELLAEPSVLYSAFSPLYKPWEVVIRTGHLGHSIAPIRAPAGASQALLQCTTVDGRPLQLQLDGERLHGIGVKVNPRDKVNFKLFVNGDIVFGPRAQVHLRVRSWPTLRGKHHEWRMEVEKLPGRNAPVVIDEWRFIH
jgi:molecular chaperone DnaK (HSP70)